ncbi:MAG: acetate/propionate family kinase, partial [Oscillospiraceae bacterium]
MKILVINAGSSSLKYQLINMETEAVLAVGICERIGIDGGIISYKNDKGQKTEEKLEFKNHKEALNKVISFLTTGETAVISNLNEIKALGHRTVQGGEKLTKSTLINNEVIKILEDCSVLAPLHNPAQILTIKVCQEIFGLDVPQVAVFDTSFHQTMPEKAYIFGVPYEYYEKYGVRRYGYHGTSHRYVSERCAKVIGKDIKDLKIVTCHLGNGCSVTAVDGGESVDTTMGLTPVGGLIMGTRCGDLDPGVLTFIAEKENLSFKEVDNLLNKKSGFLGLSGISSDARDLEDAANSGNKRAQLALDIQYYQVKKYIGAF